MLQRFCRICLAVNKPRSCSETLRLGVGMEIFHGMQRMPSRVFFAILGPRDLSAEACTFCKTRDTPDVDDFIQSRRDRNNRFDTC